MNEFSEIVLDIEAEGLFNWVSKTYPSEIFCAVAKDIHSKKTICFIPESYFENAPEIDNNQYESLNNLPEFLKGVNKVIGHNFISYDRLLLRHVFKHKIPVKNIEDTLILSQIFSPQIKGGHSLDSWGKRVGIDKPKHEDWSKFSYEMLHRCKEDVEINYKVYKYLKNKLKIFSSFSIRMEHKVRELINNQEMRGCPLDVEKTEKLKDEIKTKAFYLRDKIENEFPPHVKFVREITPKYRTVKTWTGEYEISEKSGRKVKVWRKDKILSLVGLKNIFTEEEIADGMVAGTFSHIKISKFNPASSPQVVDFMNKAGWKPYIFTKKGTPKTCEENFDTLPSNVSQNVKNLVDWRVCESRWKLFQSYLDNTDKKGRVHGSLNPLGTRTGRMAHSKPNLGNVPSDKALYGQEVRECFTVGDPETEVMVGADASGIQLRGLAHYVGNEDYINTVVGEDSHMEHAKILDFIRADETDPKVMEEGRINSKTFIYTWLFGGSDSMLGKRLGGGKELGKEKRTIFYDRVTGLREFLDKKKRESYRGYMRAIDGRIFQVPSDHLSLPLYLQGFEQAVMKYAMIDYHKVLEENKIPFYQALMVHDEFEVITKKEYGEIVGETMVQSIKKAGEKLNSKCPLAGEYLIGKNWYEVHN